MRAGEAAVKVILKDGVTIHGRAIDDDRSLPLAGVEVTAGFRDERKAVSDEGGAFVIRGLPFTGLHRGHVHVRARHPDFTPFAGARIGLETSPVAPLEVRLTRAGTIRGRILDASGGPLAGARVWIEVNGLSRETMGWNPVSGIRAVSWFLGIAAALKSPGLVQLHAENPSLTAIPPLYSSP